MPGEGEFTEVDQQVQDQSTTEQVPNQVEGQQAASQPLKPEGEGAPEKPSYKSKVLDAFPDHEQLDNTVMDLFQRAQKAQELEQFVQDLQNDPVMAAAIAQKRQGQGRQQQPQYDPVVEMARQQIRQLQESGDLVGAARLQSELQLHFMAPAIEQRVNEVMQRSYAEKEGPRMLREQFLANPALADIHDDVDEAVALVQSGVQPADVVKHLRSIATRRINKANARKAQNDKNSWMTPTDGGFSSDRSNNQKDDGWEARMRKALPGLLNS